jgi:hypothetical protein
MIDAQVVRGDSPEAVPDDNGNRSASFWGERKL